MRFTRYPKGEAYQITPRKLAAARRAVQREKDRYPLFRELLKHQTAEDRLASIAVERERWWPPSFARPAGRTAGRDQTLLEDLRLSCRSCLSAHPDSRASSQKSLLLARHGRAPAPSTPLPKIKLTASRKPLTRRKRSGDFLLRMEELPTLHYSATPSLQLSRTRTTTSSRTIGKSVSAASTAGTGS